MSVSTTEKDPLEIEQKRKATKFFDDLKERTAKLNLPQAPDKVIEALMKEPVYKAVLMRRFGSITPDDFLVNAYHLVYLVNLVYPGYVLTLGDGSGHIGRRMELPYSKGNIDLSEPNPADPDQLLALLGISRERFVKEFADFSWSMRQLSLQSPDEGIKQLQPYANIQRLAKKPNILLFTAHSNTVFSRLTPANRRPLELFVAEHLFHVPGYPPSFNFPVEYGLSAFRG